MRDFADWIYKGLEAEYDYRLSDENIDERIGDGEYQFQSATGKIV
jgi:predicted DNA-binding protein